MKKSAATAVRPLSALTAALVLSFSLADPLAAQTSSDPYLNYLDHVSIDFAHYTAISTNEALYYRDSYGDLEHPIDEIGGSGIFYLFSTKEFHYLTYGRDGISRATAADGWFPLAAPFGTDMSLINASEISYTPHGEPYAPTDNAPNPLYTERALMTGSRNTLYNYNVLQRVRMGTITLATDPSTARYTPATALLATGAYSALLTTNGGIYSWNNPLDVVGTQIVTPFITAQGSGPGQVSNPSAFNIGPDGLLYVLDYGNNRIEKFDRDTGVYRGEFALPAGITVSPSSLAISTEGHIYLGDGAGGGFVFNLNGTLLTTFHPPAADPSWVDGGLINVGGPAGVGSFLTYDGVGNVFTYVEGKGLFMYRDPFYNELDRVNLNVLSAVTSTPGNAIFNSLSFDDDRAVLGDRRNGTLTIVEPVQVRTGNIYTENGATGTIEGGSIVTAGDVTKINQGTLILNNTNTYTGRTIVQDGTLIVNGSVAGEVVVKSGTRLGGHGVIGALTLESGATIAPGNSPGTLHASDTTIAGGAAFQFQINNATGSAGTNYDLLAISGTLTLTATSANPFLIDLTSLQLVDNFDPAANYSFTFITTTGGVIGFAADAFVVSTANFQNPFTGTWSVSLTNSGHDVSLNYTGVSAIPEPSTYAAFAGIFVLAVTMIRRRCYH